MWSLYRDVVVSNDCQLLHSMSRLQATPEPLHRSEIVALLNVKETFCQERGYRPKRSDIVRFWETRNENLGFRIHLNV